MIHPFWVLCASACAEAGLNVPVHITTEDMNLSGDLSVTLLRILGATKPEPSGRSLLGIIKSFPCSPIVRFESRDPPRFLRRVGYARLQVEIDAADNYDSFCHW